MICCVYLIYAACENRDYITVKVLWVILLPVYPNNKEPCTELLSFLIKKKKFYQHNYIEKYCDIMQNSICNKDLRGLGFILRNYSEFLAIHDLQIMRSI